MVYENIEMEDRLGRAQGKESWVKSINNVLTILCSPAHLPMTSVARWQNLVCGMALESFMALFMYFKHALQSHNLNSKITTHKCIFSFQLYTNSLYVYIYILTGYWLVVVYTKIYRFFSINVHFHTEKRQ